MEAFIRGEGRLRAQAYAEREQLRHDLASLQVRINVSILSCARLKTNVSGSAMSGPCPKSCSTLGRLPYSLIKRRSRAAAP